MTLEAIWLALLGLLLAGYFVLGGYDYGVQMLQSTLARGETERRLALNSFGPFFLGNEVWLVAFAGVLIGAFPFLEGPLLSGMYLLFVVIIGGVVLGNVSVQLRSRHTGRWSRAIWDRLVLIGGVVPAVGWGLVLGLLLRGLPLTPERTFAIGAAELLDPFVLLCGVTTLALFAGHGATFLAMRTTGGLRERAGRAGRPLLVVAALFALAAAGVGAVSGVAAAGLTAAILAVALLLALGAAVVALSKGATRAAFAATSCAAVLPVLIVGFGLYPDLLVPADGGAHRMALPEAAADTATLQLLMPVGALVIPLLIAFQAFNWWAFRARVDERQSLYL
ncbi:cytochrome d ubiquinol oxidase subunit II [Streptosporangium sp. KLBMP 9127]|nr:cytochrome d ubiquinol oxidase subunit II [Streptosporangium sp. KLBMP 9127]